MGKTTRRALSDKPKASQKTELAPKPKAPVPPPAPEPESVEASPPLTPTGLDLVQEMSPDDADKLRTETSGSYEEAGRGKPKEYFPSGRPLPDRVPGNFACRLLSLGVDETSCKASGRYYAMKFRSVVEVVNRDTGAVVAVYDGRKCAEAAPTKNALSAKPEHTPRTATARTSGGGKTAEIVRLLLRKDGATKDEIKAVTGWGFGDSYIERVALSHKFNMRKAGDRYFFTAPS